MHVRRETDSSPPRAPPCDALTASTPTGRLLSARGSRPQSVFQFLGRRVLQLLQKACGGCGCCLCCLCICVTKSKASAAGNNLRKLLPQIEGVAVGPYVCGDQMAYCDVAIYCTLMQVRCLPLLPAPPPPHTAFSVHASLPAQP